MTKEYIKELGLWKREVAGNYSKTVFYSVDEEGEILHSVDDQPASITTEIETGNLISQAWYRYGVAHRGNNKPAEVYTDGDCRYYFNGEIHRTDGGPAYISNLGIKQWFINGIYTRLGGGATFVTGEGTQYWLIGTDINNMLHNEHGPAVIHPDGTVEYWLGGKQVSEEFHKQLFGN